MPGLLGKKVGMTSVYSEDGKLFPVTIVEAGPCQVIQVKNKKIDGYEALSLGFGSKKEKHLSKPQIVNYKKNSLTPSAVIKEFRNYENMAEYKIGDSISVDIFNAGDKIKVTGKSKGKGFQGVMKRHGFSGVGGTTHGQGDRLRAPGSIGQSSWPSRVFKGTRMAGRTGNRQITTSNLTVVKVIAEKNLILVKGAVPGAVNSMVEINK